MGLLGDTTEVKALSVDGVAPETEQIKKENYPLSRTFYLAYSGELSELEQDFLSYVNGAGQKIVSKNFVSVKKKPADSFLSGKQSGSIKISGSTSVAPLLQQLSRRLCCEADFPHEIGVFLGYPLYDVVGFIENAGRNFTCCGCWKAYGDPSAAQRHFAQLNKCTAVYLRLFRSGTPIQRLAVAA